MTKSLLDDFILICNAIDSNFGYSGYRKNPSLIIPTIATPKNPVSNLSFDNNGTAYLEIAVTGATKEEVTVTRDGESIVVERTNKLKESSTKEYAYRHISEKEFKNLYRCSDKQDLDNIKVKLENGMLSITIPLKEGSKPIQKTLEIE